MSRESGLRRTLRAWMLRAVPLMTTCEEADRFIDDYLDGALSPGVRRRFELHLGLCTACRRYLEGYARTIALVRASGGERGERAKDEIPPELVRAILEARKGGP